MATFSKPTRKTIPAKTGGAQRNQAIKLPRFSAPHHDAQFFTNAPFVSFWMASWWLNSKQPSMTTIHHLLMCGSHTLCSLDKPTGMPSASKSKVVVQPNRFCFSKSPATFLVFFVNGGREFLSTIFGSVWKCLVCMSLMWWLQQMVIARTWIFLDARYSYDVSQKNMQGYMVMDHHSRFANER